MLLPALSFLLLVSSFTTTKAEITLEEGVLVLDNDNFQVILSRVSLIIASAYYSGPTLRISNHLYWPNEIRTNAH